MKTTLIVGIFGLLTFPFAQGQTPVSPLNDVPLTEGLKAYWKLDETNSTRFDSTTNQFHLTPHNGVQLNPDGKLNGAALFNAFQGDQGLYVANTDARVPLTFSGDWAVSSWVNHQAMRYDADHIFNKWGEIHFYVDNYTGPHRLHLLMMSGTANHSLLLNHQFAYVMPTNVWRHLLLQRNGNSIELYVDGQFEENVTFTNSVQNGGWDFWVGMEKNGWPWNGSIDEVGYWGRSLSSAEISTLYGNGTPPAFESFGDGAGTPCIVQAAGRYNGLFHESDEVRHHSSGFVSMVLNKNARFTGKLSLDGDALPFTSRFETDGTASFSVSRKKSGKPNLTLALSLNCATDQILGTVSDGEWTATLIADRAVHPKNFATNLSGRYTMLLPGATEAQDGPPGYGYATISISNDGRVKLSGRLADASPVRQSVRISKNRHTPFFSRLYPQVENRNAINFNGSTLGWLTFTNSNFTTNNAPAGSVSWIKTAVTPASKYYNVPFTNQTDVLGSVYTPLVTRMIGAPDLESGTFFFEHGDLSAYQVLCSTNASSTNADSALVSFNSKSGLFKGSFSHPDNLNHKRTFNGALLQEQNCGGGFFMSTNQVGLMLFRRD
ncbi:MAG: LamG domain-containing protein [Verrucomicrobia bacterium]|nr:LamG domain-containing protein [Verrucomicrobiota bacterium]